MLLTLLHERERGTPSRPLPEQDTFAPSRFAFSAACHSNISLAPVGSSIVISAQLVRCGSAARRRLATTCKPSATQTRMSINAAAPRSQESVVTCAQHPSVARRMAHALRFGSLRCGAMLSGGMRRCCYMHRCLSLVEREAAAAGAIGGLEDAPERASPPHAYAARPSL